MAEEKKKPAARKTTKAAPATKAKAAAKKPAAKKTAAAKKPAARKPATSRAVSRVKTPANDGAAALDVNAYKERAADKAREATNQGIATASDAAQNLGKLIKDSAETLDSNVGEKYGDYARNAADTVTDLASKLEKKDADELLEDARGFIRKSPAIAIGAAAAIGFVLARLIKSGTDD